MRKKRFTILFTSVGSLMVTAVAGAAQDSRQETSRRIVHVFDFDERGAGNLEDVPKFWVPMRHAHNTLRANTGGLTRGKSQNRQVHNQGLSTVGSGG